MNHMLRHSMMWKAAGFAPVGVRRVGFAHGSPTFKPVLRKVT